MLGHFFGISLVEKFQVNVRVTFSRKYIVFSSSLSSWVFIIRVMFTINLRRWLFHAVLYLQCFYSQLC